MSGLRFALRAVAATLALALPVSLALPAHAAPSATAGLYGTQDPTYDGVFRQSLAILGLDAAGVQPSKPAIRWLLNAQCADGSFQEFRANPSAPCDPVDPTNGTGPDTNATAAAAAALRAIGTPAASKAAARAITWLQAQQAADGGWPFFPGQAPDANSTGLVLAAMRDAKPGGRASAVVRGSAFLNGLAAPCDAGGGLPYQAGAKVDPSASAQGLLGLTGFLPIRTPRPLGPDPTCGMSGIRKVSTYLVQSIRANGGLLPSAMGSGPDVTNTVNAVLGLTAAGIAKPTVAKAMGALRASVRDYALKDGAPVPAALGLLLLTAKATGADARDFGGVDLVRQLQRSERR